MIKKILKTKLTEGVILPNLKIKKDPENVIIGFLGFKVDKRNDGWIEIKNAGSGKFWALFKTEEIKNKGRLYLGFAFGQPFVYFRPYKTIINLNEVRKTVREIKRKYRFVLLDWTYRGGSKTGYYHFRAEIIDLFRFVRFLTPIPKIEYEEIKFPKIYGVRISSDPFKVLSYVPVFFYSFKLFSGKLIFRKVLNLFTGYVLLVREIIKIKDGRYKILGGYIPNHVDLFCFTGILDSNVWSCKTTLALDCIQGGFGKILE